jgi:hypothetical protein
MDDIDHPPTAQKFFLDTHVTIEIPMPQATSRSSSVTRLVLILAAGVLLFAVIGYFNGSRASERFSTQQYQPVVTAAPTDGNGNGNGGFAAQRFSPMMGHAAGAGYAASGDGPAGIEPLSNVAFIPLPGQMAKGGPTAPADPFPMDRVTPDQLLPKDASICKWAEANPAGQGDVKDQNFLTAGYHIGFDTQGSSLRNASHDIRSTPPNPRHHVSIWQQSTIDADVNRRPLE